MRVSFFFVSILFSELISPFYAAESYREERQEASSRQGPLPDLLPQNEHPSWASPHHRAPRGEAVQDLEVRRVANQLRAIGDEFNATVLLRAVRRETGLFFNLFLFFKFYFLNFILTF